MKIEHLAIWVEDLEIMKSFYEKYFNGQAGEKYINHKKHFSSYFLHFEEHGARLELMHRPDIDEPAAKRGFAKGMAHMAVLVDSRDAVDKITERLRSDSYNIASEARLTGDGYYESAILDPEGNYIEICSK